MEGNTGFYYVRSTPQTLQLWADAFAAAPKFPKLDGTFPAPVALSLWLSSRDRL